MRTTADATSDGSIRTDGDRRLVRVITRDAVSACAPGRVELLGNHTDYNEGVVRRGDQSRDLRVW